jgi:hypothetical protein
MDGGPPVRDERLALGSDPAVAAALIGAIAAHAGIAAELVTRPMLGVALVLPAHADTREVARALDAEQATVGFLDFQGRACVALPTEMAHIAQTAHSVAKVAHLLWEIHSGFIDAQSDACPLPSLGPSDAHVAANALLDAVGALCTAYADWQQVPTPCDDLQVLVGEGLAIVQEVLRGANDLVPRDMA